MHSHFPAWETAGPFLQTKNRFLSGQADIVTLTRKEAENAWKIGGSLYITDGELTESDGTVWIASEKPEDFILQIDFSGDRAELYQNGRLADDRFATGLPWRVALGNLL